MSKQYPINLINARRRCSHLEKLVDHPFFHVNQNCPRLDDKMIKLGKEFPREIGPKKWFSRLQKGIVIRLADLAFAFNSGTDCQNRLPTWLSDAHYQRSNRNFLGHISQCLA